MASLAWGAERPQLPLSGSHRLHFVWALIGCFLNDLLGFLSANGTDCGQWLVFAFCMECDVDVIDKQD